MKTSPHAAPALVMPLAAVARAARAPVARGPCAPMRPVIPFPPVIQARRFARRAAPAQRVRLDPRNEFIIAAAPGAERETGA